ncbi:MAG: N-acetylmuramoyl-L-alanine amidase [Lactococcus lactis]|nr:N-acetylmuramoyl-L-alanine amidase [Lactococcus lactis]MDN6423781.1 N-acetylmuramoyl-L-alanine amidase [Tetragenococcus koreensis]
MVKIKKQLVSSSIANSVSFNTPNKKRYITVHQTGNTSKGANAVMHARLQSNGNSRNAGWQWQVDDKVAIQSISNNKSAYHAGSYKGNTESIGVEHCVNSDANYKKVLQNGAELVADIMKKENIPLSRVVQHNYWSGKNCPTQLRAGKAGISWSDYKKMVQQAYKGNKPIIPSGNSKPSNKPFKGSIVDYLHQQGIKSNMANRKNLAVEYGIVSKESDYTGTAKQNTALLKTMQKGKPKQEGTRKEPIKSGYKGNSIVDYLVSIGKNTSFANRKKLAKQYGISNYKGTASQNKQLLNAMRSGSLSKSISTMAKEVEAGKHGSGHANRRKSLGISQSKYDKVRAEVNRRAGVKSKPKQSINQMANRILTAKSVPNGHSARRKWLGIGNATYQKVRARVNQKLS